MATPPPEYKRSFESEPDWNLLGQLNRVVLQISGFSFRTKQLGLAIAIAVIELLIKFTDNELDQSIFVSRINYPGKLLGSQLHLILLPSENPRCDG